MGIVYPSEAVARRWDGALQTRLRRAPLESFLKAQSLIPAPDGVSRDSDDLVRATVLIVEVGLALYFSDREEALAFQQRPLLAHVACLVSLALAQQISQPDRWRTVALVSTAKLLSPWMGLNAAAVASACAARQFDQEIAKGISPLDWRIMRSASDAVKASANIAARLNAKEASAENCATQGLRELNSGL